MIPANNPNLKTWVKIPEKSDFSIQNLPFGICHTPHGKRVACSAIGTFIIDLAQLYEGGLLGQLEFLHRTDLENQYLNDLLAHGRKNVGKLRNRLSEIYSDDASPELREVGEKALVPMTDVEMLLPIKIGDYTDFYSSREHATNVGSMFRDPDNALLPNWLHLPVGYHGRASSIVVSGTPVKRPNGQTIPASSDQPVYGPSRLLDFELEMGFVICKENTLGASITTEEAADHIIGMTLFNDWSARDIQKWEYVPLGPFLGKSFISTMSPWIITLDALEPFRVPGPKQDPEVLPYLKSPEPRNYNIKLAVDITTSGGATKTVCESNFKYMYWSIHQQLAHHTINGCNVRVGDLYASGTISGKEKSSYGSMLELTWRGTNPIQMPDGTERKFIQDGDTVTLKGFCEKEGVRVGFGEARGTVIAAG